MADLASHLAHRLRNVVTKLADTAQSTTTPNFKLDQKRTLMSIRAPDFDFDDYHNEIRAATNSSKHLIDKEPIGKVLLVPNPSVLRIYGLPKVHKEGSPLRPVVSSISAPPYLLAKFLDNWLKQVTCFNFFSSIKNSVDLVSDLAHNPLPRREAP
mgnify:CR=1 FL=1